MFCSYRELVKSTSVGHTVLCRFSNPHCHSLAVVKASSLFIYDVLSMNTNAQIPSRYTNTQKTNDAETDNFRDANNSHKMDGTPNDDNTQNKECSNNQPSEYSRLVLAHTFQLQGVVASIAAVRTNTEAGLSGLDSLIICFAQAKISLVEYSLAENNLKTVSLHYYERPEFQTAGSTDTAGPIVRVDPQSRCAIATLYSEYFVVLPFTSDLVAARSLEDKS